MDRKEMLLIALANMAKDSDRSFMEEVLVVLWDHNITKLGNSSRTFNMTVAYHMAKLKKFFIEGELDVPDEQDALFLMNSLLITSSRERKELGRDLINLVNKIEEENDGE